MAFNYVKEILNFNALFPVIHGWHMIRCFIIFE